MAQFTSFLKLEALSASEECVECQIPASSNVQCRFSEIKVRAEDKLVSYFVSLRTTVT